MGALSSLRHQPCPSPLLAPAPTIRPVPPPPHPSPPPNPHSSRILWGLAGPLTYNICIATFVATYETLLAWNLLPPLLPGMEWPSIVMSAEGPFSLSTFVLSLLLVFRTNSAYARCGQRARGCEKRGPRVWGSGCWAVGVGLSWVDTQPMGRCRCKCRCSYR